MFCPNCGRPNRESVHFCEFCGKRLPEPDASFGDPRRPAPAPQAYVPAKPLTVRDSFGSYVVLAALLAYTAMLFIELIRSSTFDLRNLSGLSPVTYSLLDHPSLFDASSGMPTFLLTALAVGISSLPILLIAIGSWVTFTSAVNRSSEMQTAGLSLIRAALIFQILFRLIRFVFLDFFLLWEITAGGLTLIRFESMPALNVLMFIGSGVFGASLCYYIGAFRMVGQMRKTVLTDAPVADISTVMIALTFLAGVFYVLLAVFLGGMMNVLSQLCTAAAYILFGCHLCNYKASMQAIRHVRAAQNKRHS